MGLNVNENKTNKQRQQQLWLKVTVDDNNFETIKLMCEFKYVITIITNDNKVG